MIREIAIRGIRGIEVGLLKGFKPLTILTGPNGSGKSAVLDAILMATSPDPASAVVNAVRRHPGVSNGIEWLLYRSMDTAQLEVELTRESDPNYWSRIIKILGLVEPEQTRLFNTKFIGVEIRDPTSNAHSRFVVGEDNRRFNEPTNLSPDPIEPSPPFATLPLVRLVDPGIPSSSTQLLQDFSHIGKSGHRDNLHHLLSELITGFDRLEIGAFTERDFGLMVAYDDGHWVPLALSGDGILALTEIAMRIAVPQGSLVLLEEPEAYLHPKAIWQLARALLANMRRGVQMVLTTHSLELIDALLGEAEGDDLGNMALFNLRLEDGVLHSGRRAGEEIAFARETLENDLR